MKTFFLILVILAGLTAGGLALRHRAEHAEMWRTLEALVMALPAAPAAAPGGQQAEGPLTLSAPGIQDGYQAGHVLLPSGESWRFAFRSHHLIGGGESCSIFAGPTGTYRLRGEYFCCEVEFREGDQPRDSAALLTLLRDSHATMEPSAAPPPASPQGMMNNK